MSELSVAPGEPAGARAAASSAAWRSWRALAAAAVVLVLAGCTDPADDDSKGRADGGTEAVAGAGLLPDAAALSPDGQRLVVPCPDALCVWSTADGTLSDTWQGGPVVAWAPEADVVATSDVSAGVAYVVLLDAADGSELRRLEGPEVETATETTRGGITDVTFSADGRTVAAAAGDGTVLVWAVEDGAPLVTLDVESPLPDVLAFDPSGDRLAVAGTEAPVQIFDLEEGDLVGTLDAEPQGDLAWSPDGSTLATNTRAAGPGARLRLWAAADLSETDTRRIQADQLDFSPDSSALAFSQKDEPEVVVWSGDAVAQRLLGSETPPRAVLWSPDGDVVHAVAADSIRSWDAATGELVLEFVDLPKSRGEDGRQVLGAPSSARP